MYTLDRREFIRTTAALTAATAVGASNSVEAAEGRRVRHAVIGTGGQGGTHARVFDSLDNCEVVALCDVDPKHLAEARTKISKVAEPKLVTDFRELLADESIDSVSIATCDHWHTPVALHALKAGKHVYVEKPCSHNVREGVALLEAAKKTGKCVQHGTQSRSSAGIQAAIQYLRDGKLGKVRVAKAINHQFRGPIGRAPVSSPPQGVNYDLWSGPAPLHPFTENRWHYNWHWFWDYGCGDIANDGVHQIDLARWGLGVEYPKRVVASGGQLFYDDDHETPDTQVVTYEYDDCYLLYEMRLWTNYPIEGHENGDVFYGDNGRLDVGRDGCIVTLNGQAPEKIGGGADVRDNMRNFIDAVAANDPGKLFAPISEGAISAALCHLGNVATRVGRPLEFDAAAVECKGDREATKLLGREYRRGYELPRV
jgi:predicted dehydrogenase